MAAPGKPPPPDNQQTDTIRRIGPYQILGKIGYGAQGDVYRAVDNIGRDLAIKELRLSGSLPTT